jgi:heme/copper-type cytochrome/quinol oxidase subunit 2
MREPREPRESRRTNANIWWWTIGILVVIGLIWWWWAAADNNDAEMREPVERDVEGVGSSYLQDAPEDKPGALLVPAFPQA